MQISLSDSVNGPMLDIIEPHQEVEILIDIANKTIWVNIDGVCRLRISKIEGIPISVNPVS